MPEGDTKKQLDLHSLIEFSNLINSNLDEDFILNYILLSIMGRMMISRGMMLMKSTPDSNDNKFIAKSSKGLQSGLQGSVLEINFPEVSIFSLSDFKSPPEIFADNKLFRFFKIFYKDKLLGVLCLGNKIDGKEFDNNEKIFIETVLNISSTSIENSLKFIEINKLNKDLNNKVTKLNSLFELSNIFYSNFENKDNIIKLLNYTLLGNYGIRNLIIFSKYRSKDYFVLSKTKNFKISDIDSEVLESLREYLLLTGNTGIEMFDELFNQGLKLAIPIFKNDNKPETVVFLGNKLNGSIFTRNDIDFLTSLVNLSVISIENSILFKEHLEKLSLENELKIAREIQNALLPIKIAQPCNYSISAINKPALHIGGDYFDIIKLTDNKYAIVIADVSGKGTPAALLMSSIQSSVRSYIKIFNEDIDIAYVTKKINELIYDNTTPEKFITFFWGILDSEKNIFRYVNAGHNYPMLFRKNGNLEYLEKGGMIIGVFLDDVEYESGEVHVDVDDVLVFYTDGINEAKNSENDEYEMKRFINVIKNNIGLTSDKITEKILEDVDKFSSGEIQYDDQTLIIIKRNK